MKYLLHAAAPALLMSLLAGGCTGAAGGGAPASASSGAMLTAPAKPNGSGVEVQYRVDGTPQIGQATTVVLSFGNITAPEGATLRIATDGELALSGAVPTNLPAHQVSTFSLGVVPGADGIAYVNVFTTQNGATSATSIPVQTGKLPSNMPMTGTLKTTPGGERVISLPAR